MTPKDKAGQLVQNFLNNHITYGGIGMTEKQAIGCAIICVDEILKVINESMLYKQSKREFWYDVKLELETL